MKIKNTLLDGEWELYIAAYSSVEALKTMPSTVKELELLGITKIPAQVPGNFELDMQRAALLPDLFFGKNALLAQSLEDRHLWYCRKFSYKADNMAKQYLNFDGIDTNSHIYLNGEKIADTNNMFIGYEFDVSDKLLQENELIVHIEPIFLEAQSHINEAGIYNFHPYNADSLYVRKAPHAFGWDIMPRILSGGLWKSVSLKEKKTARIEDTYFFTVKANAEKADVWGYYRVSPAANIKDFRLKISGKCNDSSFYWEGRLWHTEGKAEFYINNPELWWPKNMGEPLLYDVNMELWQGETLEDKKTIKLGIRKVDLQLTGLTDEQGSGEFCFYVNEKKMFVMGTNWVPLDAFHSRDAQRLPKALELLDDIGVNMVRCWGGNVYEDHEFFDFCDTHGIAVWQDFSMGCALYPQDEYFCSKLKQEAEYIVNKLRQHPSLFVWAGDNEVDEAYTQWSPLVRDPNKNKLTRNIIPDALSRFDPVRPYLPSSPYVNKQAFESKNFYNTPERHLWGPRDYYKGEFYVNNTAHFASETGYHGCPSPKSLECFISKEKLWPPDNNDEWLVHAACMQLDEWDPYAYRIQLMIDQVKTLWGEIPDNLEEFSLASQISQAEAVKFFIERFRSDKWRRTGIIWWNLLDGWPQISDAVVDYFYNRKVAYNFIKRSQQPVCLFCSEPENGELSLIAANELPRRVFVTYSVKSMSDDMIVASGELELAEFSSAVAQKIPCDLSNTELYLIEWSVEGENYCNHYLCGLPPYNLDRYIELAGRAGLLQADGFSTLSFERK